MASKPDYLDMAHAFAEKAEEALQGGLNRGEAAIVQSNLAIFYLLAQHVDTTREDRIDVLNQLHDIEESVGAIRDITTSVEESVDGIGSAVDANPNGANKT